MNKKILIESTLAIIIVLTSFSSVACAHSISLKDSWITIIGTKNDWKPGSILGFIEDLIMQIIFVLFGWMFP